MAASSLLRVCECRVEIEARSAAGASFASTARERTWPTWASAASLRFTRLPASGQQATVFPSHNGGFLGGEFGYAGHPKPSRTAARGARRLTPAILLTAAVPRPDDTASTEHALRVVPF